MTSNSRSQALSSRWTWALLRLTRRMWFRATLLSVLAVITALAALALAPYIPLDLPAKIGSDAVDGILHIIASSMLAVTTFSLSTMVTAYGAATSNVTPRATQLVIEDATTQNVLATFIGSFLFSLVGIIVLATGAYGEQGRVVLFVVTILVIVLIVVTLLRWIDHLSRLGRVADTTDKVEKATLHALTARRSQPGLGGLPIDSRHRSAPLGAKPVYPDRIGYVQHLDVGALSRLAEKVGSEIVVNAIPGDLVDPTAPLAWLRGQDVPEREVGLRNAFTLGDTRSFDQDPRFGASVLAEIASRALSPAINDPGTAIDVLSRAVRVMSVWVGPDAKADPLLYPRIQVPTLDLGDLFDDLFTPIARDGAAIVEVGVRLQKALATVAELGGTPFEVHARRHAAEALERAEAALMIENDKIRVRDAAAAVIAPGSMVSAR